MAYIVIYSAETKYGTNWSKAAN